MEVDKHDELFAIIRQQELHIRTLQMLLEVITAMLTQPYADMLEGAAPLETKLLGKIDEVSRSTGDHQLGDSMRASMSEIIVDFFHNVRRLGSPPATHT
jgi:hypothetical protein